MEEVGRPILKVRMEMGGLDRDMSFHAATSAGVRTGFGANVEAGIENAPLRSLGPSVSQSCSYYTPRKQSLGDSGSRQDLYSHGHIAAEASFKSLKV